MWWRSTPSFFAPRRSIARWDAKLKLSVRRPTTAHLSDSNACVEQEQLARRVHVRALKSRRVPRPTNLHAIDRRDDVVVARAADDPAARRVAHGPRQHVAVALAGERVVDVRGNLVGRGDRRVPDLPQISVGRRGGQTRTMVLRERLETNAVAFEDDWAGMDHVARCAMTASAAPRAR